MSKGEVNVSKTLPDIKISIDEDIADLQRPDLIQEVEPTGDVYGLKTKAEALAFAEQKLTIYLHEPAGPNDEPVVFCAVNGEPALPNNPYLRRGMEHTLKRKHVEQLMRAQGVTYTQPFAAERDERVNHLRPHRAMKYPFDVRHDPAGERGVAWRRQLMAY